MPLTQFDGIVYINLKRRPDRRASLMQVLEKLHVDFAKVHRIEAVDDPLNGVKGCLLSHIQALDLIQNKGWERGLILEDDVIFHCTIDEIKARRLTADLIDRKVRDFTHISAFPKEANGFINLILSVIEEAAEKCTDIPLKDPSIAPPVPGVENDEGGHPNWHLFSPDEKLDHIKEIIRDEIQPYIELDAGGIEVAAFKDEKEIIIAYRGACTSCPSSTGATLDAIQHILRSRLSPLLTVKPDLSLLSF